MKPASGDSLKRGIYKYRVLGPFLLLKTHQALKSDAVPSIVKRCILLQFMPGLLAARKPDADPFFYAAYVVQNTLFLILTPWYSIVSCSIRGPAT